MPAYAGCPRTACIVGILIPSGEVEPSVDLADDAPVYHVVALQHLHAEVVEVACHEVVFLSHANDVRIAVVGI